MTDNEIIQLIRQGDHTSALKCLYGNYNSFKSSFRKAGGDITSAADIFQEALLILIQKISEPGFQLTCSLNGYLFGICRNLSHQYFRKKSKVHVSELSFDSEVCDNPDVDYYTDEECKYSAVDKALMKIGRQCIDILNLFYCQNLSMAAIAQRLGFKSEQSAKTQKYKCIERARNLTMQLMPETNTENL